MVELHRAKRCLPLPWTALAWLAVALLAAGCQSTPSEKVSISSRSSLLAVDVVFPAPLRDPALVQAFLVKGPIHGGMPELPELVPPTFVKRSRAYWLDPEPGTYSVVAVTSAYSPPWNERPIAGADPPDPDHHCAGAGRLHGGARAATGRAHQRQDRVP